MRRKSACAWPVERLLDLERNLNPFEVERVELGGIAKEGIVGEVISSYWICQPIARSSST